MLIAALLAFIVIILLLAPKKASKEEIQKEASRIAYEGLDSLKQSPSVVNEEAHKEGEYGVYESGKVETPAVPDENKDPANPFFSR